MKKSNRNKGIALIEITLLIPIILGVFYLYICFFLYLIESGNDMSIMANRLYSTENISTTEQEENFTMNIQGKTKSICVKKNTGMFYLDLEMYRNDDSVVKNIRGWQLATDTIY